MLNLYNYYRFVVFVENIRVVSEMLNAPCVLGGNAESGEQECRSVHHKRQLHPSVHHSGHPKHTRGGRQPH